MLGGMDENVARANLSRYFTSCSSSEPPASACARCLRTPLTSLSKTATSPGTQKMQKKVSNTLIASMSSRGALVSVASGPATTRALQLSRTAATSAGAAVREPLVPYGTTRSVPTRVFELRLGLPGLIMDAQLLVRRSRLVLALPGGLSRMDTCEDRTIVPCEDRVVVKATTLRARPQRAEGPGVKNDPGLEKVRGVPSSACCSLVDMRNARRTVSKAPVRRTCRSWVSARRCVTKEVDKKRQA
mmetsp:Transcript_46998/g.109647  ORF Transcript_46998/g.109647 Transcript_46998/m.109647 type:complete len:244 (-) Transcript_46998:869-1600(-)